MMWARRLPNAGSPCHEKRHYVKSDMAASAGHESFAAQANASEGLAY